MSYYDSDTVKKFLQMKISNEISKIAQPRFLYGELTLLNKINYIFDFKFQDKFMGKDNIVVFQNDLDAEDASEANNIIFFVYPSVKSIKAIGKIIIHNKAMLKMKKYYLFLVPRDNFLSTAQLNDLQLLDQVVVKNFDFSLIPFPSNILSLQLPLTVEDFQLNSCVVQSLLKITNINGKFKSIYGKGKSSKHILKTYQKKIQTIPDLTEGKDNTMLILIDRKIDLVTPMITPYCYVSLVDKFFGISFNKVRIPKGILGLEDKEDQDIILDNPRSTTFKEIQRMQIQQASTYLKQKSDRLNKQIIELKNNATCLKQLNDLNDNQMFNFIIVQHHRCLAADILEKLRESHIVNSIQLESNFILSASGYNLQNLEILSAFYPIQSILRLITLLSHTSSNSNFLEKKRKEINQLIINNYSVKDLIAWKTLVEKSIINKPQKSQKQRNWNQIRNKFQLIPEENEKSTYQNIHIAFRPLSIRYLELLLTNKLTVQLANLVPGDLYSQGQIAIKKDSLIYLYFVGGITHGQIQCLKILEDMLKVKFIICTTNLIEGDRYIRQICQIKQPQIKKP